MERLGEWRDLLGIYKLQIHITQPKILTRTKNVKGTQQTTRAKDERTDKKENY